MKKEVARVYDEVLKQQAVAYLALDTQVITAETAFAMENSEATKALADLDEPYRVARSVVAAHVKETVLPDTLKVQPTDTDRVNVIEQLLDAVDDHAGQAWADELIAGPFGTKGASTVKEIHEATAANKTLSAARQARAAAYGPTYEVYLRFKRVVRDALGASSKQYRRIHLRSVDAAEAAEGKPPTT